ncbi:hypothetical protein BDF19DRAFT_450881 [Syncephalis fuscata]|nr:hypothetical protein BDF19DRAFT_450881 [Syncephalis fuscata]
MELAKQLQAHQSYKAAYTASLDAPDYIEYLKDVSDEESSDEELTLTKDQQLLMTLTAGISRSTEDPTGKEIGRKGRRSRQPRIESDSYGRNLLHYAASWGCTNVIRAARRIVCRSEELNTQLSQRKNRDIFTAHIAGTIIAGANQRDEESGWTPLHRALYYGHFRTAIELLKIKGIDTSIKDHDDLDPIDMLREYLPLSATSNSLYGAHHHHNIYDYTVSLSKRTLETNDRTEYEKNKTHWPHIHTTLYTWGKNSNYVLGHADQNDRTRPDRVSLTSHETSTLENHTKLDIEATSQTASSIVAIAMSKFHMIVLTAPTTTSNLLTCGFGHGGRLGNSESTRFVLKPVQGLPDSVSTAACGRDHTVVITTKGEVYTFGRNRWGQLGYPISQDETFNTAQKYDKEDPVQLEPKRVLGVLRQQIIIGCAASTWHTAVHTKDTLYTFGRDQGQLGYEITGTHQIQPRHVSQLPHHQLILQVVATETATACLMENGEVYTLMQGRCQRISLPVHRIPPEMHAYQPLSAPLPHVTRLSSDTEGYMGALTVWGDVFIWPTDQSINIANKRTRSIKRVWSPRNISTQAVGFGIGHDARVILCTRSGQVWTSRENGKMERLPQLHRVTNVCAGTSGSYAAVHTELPLCLISPISPTLSHDLIQSLLNNEDESKDAAYRLKYQLTTAPVHSWNGDGLGDIQIVSEHYSTMAHRVILTRRSPVLKRLLLTIENECRIGRDSLTIRYTSTPCRIEITGCTLEALLSTLVFIYSRQYTIQPDFTDDVIRLAQLLELHELRSMIHNNSSATGSSLTLLYNAQLVSSAITNNAGNLWTLGDYADIILDLSDGQVMAHRTILCHRSDFFAAILAHDSPWLIGRDTIPRINLKHCNWSTMKLALKYMYTDEGAELLDEQTFGNTEDYFIFMQELLGLADELLLERLKQICQQLLSQYVNMHTVLLLADMAERHHARQLLDVCLDYLCNNIDAALELRLLYKTDAILLHRLEKEWRRRQARKWSTTRNFDAQLAYHTDDWSKPMSKARFSSSANTESIVAKNNDSNGSSISSVSAAAIPKLLLSTKKANRKSNKLPLSLKSDNNIKSNNHNNNNSDIKMTWASQSPKKHESKITSSERLLLVDIMQEQKATSSTTSSSASKKQAASIAKSIAVTSPNTMSRVAMPTSPPATKETTTIPIAIKPKLSQRERKRQSQHTGKDQISPRTPPTAAAAVTWGLPTSSSITSIIPTGQSPSKAAPSPIAINKTRRDSKEGRVERPSHRVIEQSAAHKSNSARGWSVPLIGTTPLMSSTSSKDFPNITTPVHDTMRTDVHKRRPSRKQQLNPSSSIPSVSTTSGEFTFIQIQREQEAEQRRLSELRSNKRSLVDIQTEELVIQAWREYYADLGIENWEPPADFKI